MNNSSVTEAQAVELARAFVAARPVLRDKCGALAGVRHKDGTFRVEFSYGGPPVKQKTKPPLDHPTIVLVDSIDGTCRLMMWM